MSQERSDQLNGSHSGRNRAVLLLVAISIALLALSNWAGPVKQSAIESGHRHTEAIDSVLPGMQVQESLDKTLTEELVSSLGPLHVSNLPHVSLPKYPFRDFVMGEVFTKRYQNAAYEDLLAAKELLGGQASRVNSAEAEKLIDAGRCETEIILLSNTTEETPLPPRGGGKGLIKSRRTEVLPGGNLRVMTTILPWDEYVALYDLNDEVVWLLNEIERRSEGAAGIHEHGEDAPR